MRPDLHRYFITLGLSPGASANDIRLSYRKLIQEWHPDRFTAGSLMQTTAEDHTKDLNEAYENLYKKRLYRKFLGMAAAKPRPDRTRQTAADGPPEADGPAPAAEPRRARRAADAAPRHEPPPPPPAPKPSFLRSRRFWKGTVLGAAVAAAGFVLVPRIGSSLGALWQPGREPARPGAPVPAQAAPTPSPVAHSRSPAPESPRSRQTSFQPQAAAEAIPVEVPPLAPPRVPGISVPATIAPSSEGIGKVALNGGVSVAPDRLRIASDPARDWISLSPESDPAPSAVLSSTLSGAELDQRLDRAETRLETFEAGDSPDRVRAVQGSPDEAVPGAFRYGSSMVYFEKGRVSGWMNGVPRLRIPALFDSDLQDEIDAFTLGSTRGEVFRIQGRPDSVAGNAYTYGQSTVIFENDRVASWIRGDRRLRTRVVPDLPFFDRP